MLTSFSVRGILTCNVRSSCPAASVVRIGCMLITILFFWSDAMKKKQPRDTLELTVDRGPRQAGIRRKARDAYLKELDLNPLNNNGIDQEIGSRINRAKSIHDRVGKPTDLEKYQFLSEVMAVFLLGSEPMSDRKSTRLNSSHVAISYAVFCL